MKVLMLIIIILISSLTFAFDESRIKKGISATGACAVINMTAEQAKLIALQNARRDAIQKAAGVKISSSSIINNGSLIADIIKEYSSGYIISENVRWKDLSQYMLDGEPIAQYNVEINADVYVPIKHHNFGLQVDSPSLYKAGDFSTITIKTRKEAQVAIFNITADDSVMMLYPNKLTKIKVVSPDKPFTFPESTDPYRIQLWTLPDHKVDVEAFIVAALPVDSVIGFDMLFGNESMTFSEFYRLYAKIGDDVEDILSAYTVIGNK